MPTTLDTAIDQANGPLPAVVPPPLHVKDPSQIKTSRQGSVEPYTLIEGPGAWYGKDFQNSVDEWAITLTPTHIEELETAIAGVLGQGLVVLSGNYLNLHGNVTKAHFPLPTLGPVLKEVQQEVIKGRGFALLRGLPVDRWSRIQTLLAYWGIGLHWGQPRRQNQKGHLIGHVKDVGIDSKHQNPLTRIYLTSVAQPWHVDASDLVGLLALKSAREGGLSSWASSVTVINELLRSEPELVHALAGSWYMDRKNEVPEGKQPYHVLPIVNYHAGHLTVTFNDSYYQLAEKRHAAAGVPPLTPLQRRALERVNEVANRQDVRIDYWLQPGDLQLLNNHTVLHTRSAYEDFEEPDRRRHLLRLWLAPPAEDGVFPLAPAYAELWGSVEPGARGGIHVEGFEETIPIEAEAGNK